MQQKPDVRLLAAGLAKHFGAPDSDVKMLESCPVAALALVILRVWARLARKSGALTDKDETAIIAASTIRMNPVQAMVAASKAEIELSDPAFATIAEIDKMLVNPLLRKHIPEWFVSQFWPELLRKLAQGGSVSEREMAISRLVAGEVHENSTQH